MAFTTTRRAMGAALCFAMLVGAACSSDTVSSTAPSPPEPVPVPVPVAAPAPVPIATANVQITITPNPVPFSGLPITDTASCAGSRNTWFYEQRLVESGGAAVSFTSRIDKFDGRVVNTSSGLTLAVPAMGTTTLQSRWCSAQAVAHTAQSSFSGTDVNGHTITVEGPVVNLKSP